jgi:2,3-bisphosphoglycerate-dependent phosphoglycerate mutase
VTEFLHDKKIDAVLSSPFKRAVDTVADFALMYGFEIETIEDFRERKSDSNWLRGSYFWPFIERQWADFSYKLSDGECLAEVQERNIAALNDVLTRYKDKNVVIGTHGTALSTIINYYDKTLGIDDYKKIVNLLPWIVRMDFNDNGCIGMEKFDLFNPDYEPNYDNVEVRIADFGSLKAYRFTVIFACYQNKWLYCRAKDRDTFETAGGRIEQGETTIEAAKRELYEETGAISFDISPAFDYSVHLPSVYSNGQVFLAEVHELGDIPDFEMAEVKLFDTIPDKMRFPKILPVLFERVKEII